MYVNVLNEVYNGQKLNKIVQKYQAAVVRNTLLGYSNRHKQFNKYTNDKQYPNLGTVND